MKYKYSKLYWFLRSFEWMKVYFSPFKPPIPRFYFGKIALGTPIFYPRVWKKVTPAKAIEEALKEIKRIKEHNEKEGSYKQTIKSFDTLYEQKLSSSFAEPKKIGFDFVSLGYKTKWSDTDFRHEWNPIWSFVFFGYQLAVTFVPEEYNHFWECWLFFEKATDKTKSKRERIEYSKIEFPCKWTTHRNGVESKVCYWDVILKNKYK
jgi:hypothetical protein